MSRLAQYRAGRLEGLREAAEIMRELQDTVNGRLELEQHSIRTRDQRRTRAKAYQVAATRITTRLRALERATRRAGQDMATQIEKLGF